MLAGVDLAWEGPGTLVVLGENGAGKSTLLRAIAGVIALDEGTVEIAGVSLLRDRLAALRRLGYAPEAVELPPHLTVGELGSLVAALKRVDPPAPALLDRLGLAPLVTARLGGLSLGQRRRACLLTALVGDPDLLVLDEPTNGLDADAITLLVELLAERTARGRAALVATHDRPFIARAADAVVEMIDGRALRERSR